MSPPQELGRLVTSFAERVPAVAHAVVVSTGGLPLACSDGLPTDRVDQLAAVSSGLTSLVQGGARIFEGGPVGQALVVMEQGMLILRPISHGSVFAVLAAPDCDLGLVAYEMVLFGERAARLLTPPAHRQPARRAPRAASP